MNTEKMKEVFSDEAFVKSLFELKTTAEAQAALKEKGVELNEEEIMAIHDLFLKVKKGEITPEQFQQIKDGELDDELLETVSGGVAHIIVGIGTVVYLIGLFIDWLVSD